MGSQRGHFVCFVLLTGIISACSNPISNQAGSGDLLQSVQTQQEGLKPKIDENADNTDIIDALIQAPAIRVTATVNKKALLSQEFLYGSDLQYSSFYFKDYDLYLQSLALGHIPARFRIAGDELQLVADNQRLFPSNVNHPEQLLSRFKILEDKGGILKITSGNAGVYLSLLFAAQGGSSGVARDSWIRSFEYIVKDQIILQQSSVMMSDGVIAEFMESIQPAAALAPGAQFEKFEMNPDDPVGAAEGPAARFRFLKGETIFDGEKKLTFAQHFDISAPNDTIDWYVTPNIPEEYLEPVRLAVVGWNRYFAKFSGIDREVVRFLGKLPEGVFIGDPRFNVINWDSRLIAGAAYESQATDPRTGKQSHSLIYMPAAWVTIGTTYWKNGQYSDPLEKLLRGSKFNCMRNLRAAASLIASGRIDADHVKEFGKELLKGTLFHEVGHALGLAHNFKGSLSFDRTQAHPIFSTSIMDYNDFEIERGAFQGVHSQDGPELEYDRQALDALYNKMKDLQTSAVVPVCNDDEADREDGGVDPLCVRYDIEKDPTLSVNTAWNRVQEKSLTGGDTSLAQALQNVVERVFSESELQKVSSEGALLSLESELTQSLGGSMGFYILSGKASLSRAVRTNVKSLLLFSEGVLPEAYSEREMRERAFAGVQKSLGSFRLSEPVVESLQAVSKKAAESISKAPYVQTLSQEAQEKARARVIQKVTGVADTFEKNTASGLPRLREMVLSALTRHEKVPFFFGKLGDRELDYESSVIAILADTVGDGAKFTQNERMAAAKSLITYRGRLDVNEIITRLNEKVGAELKQAKSNATRENSQAILGVLL